ncbi:hypothetical protein YTPLAS72_27560 [Nitrospira sp.]|nr:hypothetical protein YTPLAS72_27560 [Nitrospira sp.]
MIYRNSAHSIMRCQPGARGLFNSDGVCLSELMISLAIGAVVLATAFTTLNIVQTHAGKQQRSLNQQQDLRLGLEVFEQEVRLATAETIVTAASDQFMFYANLSDYRTATTAGVHPGQTVLPVLDGSGWGEGKTLSVCGRQGCESHRLARAGQRFHLTLVDPIESSFPEGASVQILNRVVYYVNRQEANQWNLMRMVDGGANVLIGGLDELRFSYRNDLGQSTVQAALVRRVILEINSDQPLHRMVREVSIRS